jgi:hypothetical protein
MITQKGFGRKWGSILIEVLSQELPGGPDENTEI